MQLNLCNYSVYISVYLAVVENVLISFGFVKTLENSIVHAKLSYI